VNCIGDIGCDTPRVTARLSTTNPLDLTADCGEREEMSVAVDIGSIGDVGADNGRFKISAKTSEWRRSELRVRVDNTDEGEGVGVDLSDSGDTGNDCELSRCDDKGPDSES